MDTLDASLQSGQDNRNHCHVLVFTSGKGGVGKTCITINVAAALVRKGARVCIFDADTGLANINILLGLSPQYTLEHVISGEKSLAEVIIHTREGLAVIPGASGIAQCANLEHQAAKRLMAALLALESDYDYLLIDTAAGIADNVIQFIEAVPCTFLVINAEPTSLTDGFSLLKLLNSRNYTGRLRVIVNQTGDYQAATSTYRRFATAVDKYLKLNVDFGGYIASDKHVVQSVSQQIPVIELAPEAPASRCLYAMADNIMKYIGTNDPEAGFSDYWRNLLIEGEGQQATEGGQSPACQSATGISESVSELSSKLVATMKAQGGERDGLEAFVIDFVSEFTEQFGCFPSVFKQLFYRWLEADNYPATRIIELVSTLEALYVSRHQQPMFSIEERAARLVAQSQGSEKQLRSLIEQLRASYRQAFQVDVFDAQQALLESIQKDDFTEERFEGLLQNLRESFQQRFNRPYRGQSDLLLETTTEALISMASDEQQLQCEMTQLSERFLQLTTRRDALLAAIGYAQQNTSQPFGAKII